MPSLLVLSHLASSSLLHYMELKNRTTSLDAISVDRKRSNSLVHRLASLPPGFRFHPTDEELIVHYLKRKVLGFPLPASVIPELNVCKSDPWDLPGDWEKERYYFSHREAKYLNGNRCNRATCSGYWKATGLDRQIVSFRSNQVVGMKKSLVFYRGKPTHQNGSKTDWIMHEYRLVNKSLQNSVVEMGDWVICRVFLKKKTSKDDQEFDQHCRVNRLENGFIDFLKQDHPSPQPCSHSASSGSSVVTEVSSTGSDTEENSS